VEPRKDEFEKPFEAESHLNNMETFSSYRKENTLFHYKDQSINPV
jgi:hypothetical protein